LQGRYVLVRHLGQGNLSKVYYARDCISTKVVAIKVIDKDTLSRVGLMVQKEMEVSIVRKIRHPNVVHLSKVMASKSKMYLVLEYAAGGELLKEISEGKFSEGVARGYFYQLISAVGYCHNRGVYHGDLKPENLLLDYCGNLKVSGFGLSALAEPKRHDGLLHTTCGTSAFEAPEMLSKKGYDGSKADIWSCGVILLVMLAGYLPFQDTNLINMYMKISSAEYRCPCPLSAELKELLSMILDPDPIARASASNVMRSAWLRKHTDVNRQKMKHETTDNVYNGQYEAFDLTECSNSGVSQASGLPNLNAFDLISLSTGFDLSNLFEEKYDRMNDKFTTRQPAETIFTKMNELAKRLKLKIMKKGNGVFKFGASKEGMKGFVKFQAEVFELAPSFLLVEFRKAHGDTTEYKQLMKEEIRPALKDVVWAWQGDSLPLPEKCIQGEQ
jgi:5'-AMP-activated protein kinase catalytic alpha subunit